MQLTPNFSLSELTKSQTAIRMGQSVVASPLIISSLTRLAVTILQPIRDRLDRPMAVSSGYRPPWLNALIGGSKTSAHMEGLACDFEAMGLSNYEACETIEGFIDDLPIDQLIYEFGEWVHVGAAREGVAPRRQVLTAVRGKAGKVEYLPGIVKQQEN